MGRQDDGLGIQLVERLENLSLPTEIGFEANYQLNAEDALTISNYDTVIFIDATMAENAPSPYSIKLLKPSSEVSFSTHAMSFGSVLGFCRNLYGKTPRACLLTIPGQSWEVNEEMSPTATANLQATFIALQSQIGKFFRYPNETEKPLPMDGNPAHA